jgi:hypothetical protein
MASTFIYWTSDGGGDDGGERAKALHKWIVAQDNASLIIYGGDIYERGQTKEYAHFLKQMGGDVSLMCETTGNHDWINRLNDHPNATPIAYEAFWSRFPPPHSQQPIDTSKVGGARYEHFIEFNGWRLIFVDSGALEFRPSWPFNDQSRLTWLKSALHGVPGRAKMVFSHFSRLSWGKHGNNPGMAEVWKSLFADDGKPLAVCTLAGHDHNVSLYKPMDRNLAPTDAAHGVQIWVNGMGGAGPYKREKDPSPNMVYPKSAEPADDPITYCVTQIELIDATTAKMRLFSFGPNPVANQNPTMLLEVPYSV